MSREECPAFTELKKSRNTFSFYEGAAYRQPILWDTGMPDTSVPCFWRSYYDLTVIKQELVTEMCTADPEHADPEYDRSSAQGITLNDSDELIGAYEVWLGDDEAVVGCIESLQRFVIKCSQA